MQKFYCKQKFHVHQSFLDESRGSDKVHIYDKKELRGFNIENYATAFEAFINQVKPAVVLVGNCTL